MTSDFTIRPVGRVESPLTDTAQAPNQAAGAPPAWLVLDQGVVEGARDLQPGQDILVLTWLHLSPRDQLATVPGDDPGGPERGVFSTRSPNRPNPVGLHRATFLAVRPGRLQVSALEVVDGTPIIDIKPPLRLEER